LGLFDYLKSLRNPNVVNALFVRRDMKPGFAYMSNLISISRKR